MTSEEFRAILQAAIAGSHEALEAILVQYEPLIHKHSYIDGKFNEDLHQYLLIHIALNINKFSI